MPSLAVSTYEQFWLSEQNLPFNRNGCGWGLIPFSSCKLWGLTLSTSLHLSSCHTPSIADTCQIHQNSIMNVTNDQQLAYQCAYSAHMGQVHHPWVAQTPIEE
jgi:hypothetical protein